MVAIGTLAAALVFSSALLLVPQSANAAVAIDTSTNGGELNGTGEHTWSHTVGSGSNKYLVVGLSGWDGGTDFDAAIDVTVTYNGIPMTNIGFAGAAGQNGVGFWGLIDPPTGIHTVSVTNAGTIEQLRGGTISFTGVSQTAPVGTFVGEDGAVSDGSVDITLAEGDLGLDALYCLNLGGPSIGAGQTERVSVDGNGAQEWHKMSTEGGSGTVTMSWTCPGGDDANGAIPIKAAAANVALSRPPNNLGLVGYWSFDDGTGTIATDFSGFGNHGTLTNTSWVSGKRGTALDFEGAEVATDTQIDGVTTTFSSWIYPHSAGNFGLGQVIHTSDGQYLFNMCSGDAVCGSLSNTLVFRRLWDAGFSTGVWYTDANTIPLNQWTHIAVSYDGSSSSNDPIIYINGTPANLTIDAPSGTIGMDTGSVIIGGGAANFDGVIDEVRVYNRVLGASEIAGLARAGAVRASASSVDLARGSSLEQGLVGHWTFDGKDTNWTSATAGTALDRSGNGNTGTLTSMNRSTSIDGGVLGQALIFDGSSDYVDMGATPSSLNLTGSLSVSAWIKPDTFGGGDRGRIVDSGGAGTDGFAFNVDDFNGTDALGFFPGTGPLTSNNSVITLGVWQHVAVSYNGTTATFYVNGVSVGSDTGSPPLSTSANFLIGDRAVNNDRQFDGLIDDVRVYNRALTAEEVKQLYQLGQVTITP